MNGFRPLRSCRLKRMRTISVLLVIYYYLNYYNYYLILFIVNCYCLEAEPLLRVKIDVNTFSMRCQYCRVSSVVDKIRENVNTVRPPRPAPTDH